MTSVLRDVEVTELVTKRESLASGALCIAAVTVAQDDPTIIAINKHAVETANAIAFVNDFDLFSGADPAGTNAPGSIVFIRDILAKFQNLGFPRRLELEFQG